MASLKHKQNPTLDDFQDLVSDWLWEADENNIIIYSNGQLEKALRRPITTLVGENLLKVFKELCLSDRSESAPSARLLSGSLDRGQEFSLPSVQFHNKNLLPMQMCLMGKPVKGIDGSKCGFRGIGRLIACEPNSGEEEVKLKTLMMAVKNTPSGIIITDPDGVIRYANPGFTEITGYTKQDVLGKTPKILSSGHTRNSAYADFWNTIKQGRSWQGTVCNKRKDGDLFWCRETVTPVIQRNGRISNYIAIQQDVTAEFKTQQELHESEERFRGFAEAASDWYWETDADLRFSYVSDSATEHADMDLQDMLGMTRAELVTQAEDQEFWIEHLEDLSQKRAFKDFTYTFVRKDGQHRRWQISGKPYYSPGGEFRGFRGVGKDITLSTELEAQLQQSQKMEVVGQLTGGIAHDFNNLLSIIMGNAELLREQLAESDAPYREKLENIIYAAKRGASITNQLLVFSRKEALKPQVVNLEELIDQMMDMLKSSMGTSIDLVLKAKAGTWCCFVDPDQFVNSVLNLCINARDAMESKGVLNISIENRPSFKPCRQMEIPSADYVVVTVRDEGVGIAKQDLSRIFEPFFSTKEAGKGTGLGLSMVYGFAKKSGGTIWIESEEGQGTTVQLFLPRHCID
ncbi:MAG: PAS domain S-box protein [Sneathiella sp.]